jgi:hypothetical protein
MNKKAALLFFLILLLFLANINYAQEIKIKVSVNKANVRLNPETSSPIISVVHAGIITQLIKKTDEWYFVELPPNEKGDVIAGYIHQNEVEEIKAETVKEKNKAAATQKLKQTQPVLPSDDWQKNVDVLGQLYFGKRYAVLRKKIINKPKLKEQMIGQRVRWAMKFQADVISRISDDQSPWEIMGHNMALEAPFGPGDDWDEMKGLVWVMSASRQEEERTIPWTEMVWGIPPGSDVVVDMKVKSVVAVRLGKDLLCIWVGGEDLNIEYDGPRCDWPTYSEKIKAEYKISPYSNALTYDDKKAFKVLVENSNPWSVKVGLRGGEKGIDFIAPPGEQGFTVAPPGDYEIYFQHQIEPESLYKGDEFTLEDNGVKITLREQMGGNFNIRKIK